MPVAKRDAREFPLSLGERDADKCPIERLLRNARHLVVLRGCYWALPSYYQSIDIVYRQPSKRQ